MNFQVTAAQDGGLLWVSGPLRGSDHDLAAARIQGLTRALAATGLLVRRQGVPGRRRAPPSRALQGT